MDAALIAIDWGTTSARAYRVDRTGAIDGERHAPLGIQNVRDGAFAPALATLLGDWASLRLPRIACGMIGSRQGWVEAPYVNAPADAEALARALAHTSSGELAVVAGVTCRDDAGMPDVMRGEETQIVGAFDGSASGIAVLPGTHSKWARVARGRIESFVTYMTGELYAVLLAHTILGRMAARGEQSRDAFVRGVQRGLAHDALSHQIFGARTLALMGELRGEDVAEWLSGALIGHEVRSGIEWARRGDTELGRVRIIGDETLAMRYAVAFQHAGIGCEIASPAAAARGLFAIARRARLID